MNIQNHNSYSLAAPLRIDHKNHSRNQAFMMNRLLQTALFIFPLQQSALKNEVHRQISHESLSLKAFKAIFPLATQMFTSREENRIIFELIRQIAENPCEEFGGRCLWIQNHGDFAQGEKDLRMKGWDGKKSLYLEDSRCQTTFDVLKSTLFGLAKSEVCNGVWHIISPLKVDEIYIPLSLVTQRKANTLLKKCWKNIEQNAAALIEKTSTAIYTYGYSLQGNRQFTGHGFWVIQYLDENASVKYRIFQSFLSEYNLKDFLHQKKEPLSHSEFMLFCEGIQKCLLADLWTEENEAHFIHYFGGASGLVIGSKNFCRDTFSMIWSIRTWADVIEQFQKFEEFRSAPGFPNITTYQQKKRTSP